MRLSPSFVTVLALVAALTAALPASASMSPKPQDAREPSKSTDGLLALDGVWVYVEDRTEGRALEQLGPPMSSTFSLRVEEGAVVLVFGHGGKRRDVRVALDGTVTEVQDAATGEVARYRGTWNDGALTYEIDFIRKPGEPPEGLIQREFRMTPDGLIVRFRESVGLYRHAEDIPLPTPAKAAIGDLGWLAGAWAGTRGTAGTTSIEERWSPPLGGAAPTEFVLTELSPQRAVFENPRHDYPKRISYELAGEGDLSATIGFTNGGTPRRFEFKREGM